MSCSSILRLENITKSFSNRLILDNLNLNINSGEFVAIIGHSGSGKSTLLNIIGALDRDFDGCIYFNQQPIKPKSFDEYRNAHIGYVFQSFNLIGNITAKENVLMPSIFSLCKNKDINSRCQELFEHFGILHIMNNKVNTLSGGEKQRVALIRSIILNPDIILADEPTGNLDPENSEMVLNFFRELNSNGKTIIMVTHDMTLAKEATRVLRLEGNIINEIK